MNKELWNSIKDFKFDQIDEEYGFTIRLASENYWTKEFTNLAILEYRKFMYMAATSDRMVSPSEVVDKVWHLHIVYTQSYQKFCELLGKNIQHIPSTHKRGEFKKFNLAKQRTRDVYRSNFGEQPKNIWENYDMFQSLNLTKSKHKLRTLIIVAIAIFIALIIPFFLLLKPIVRTIGNPDFIIYLLVSTAVILFSLELFNVRQLKKITKSFDKDSFIFKLNAFELVYLKTQNIANVIHGHINQLFLKDYTYLKSEQTIGANKNSTHKLNREELIIYDIVNEDGSTSFPSLIKALRNKPIFSNAQNSMDAFKKYFLKSKKFATLFLINFAVISSIIMVSFVRLSLGFIRGKPIGFIFALTAILCFLMYFFLNRLTLQVCKETIPNIYKYELLTEDQKNDDWQWSYFLIGTMALSSGLATLVNYRQPISNTYDSSDSCSSCSSCSSCGGCGGCGD